MFKILFQDYSETLVYINFFVSLFCSQFPQSILSAACFMLARSSDQTFGEVAGHATEESASLVKVLFAFILCSAWRGVAYPWWITSAALDKVESQLRRVRACFSCCIPRNHQQMSQVTPMQNSARSNPDTGYAAQMDIWRSDNIPNSNVTTGTELDGRGLENNQSTWESSPKFEREVMTDSCIREERRDYDQNYDHTGDHECTETLVNNGDNIPGTSEQTNYCKSDYPNLSQ